MPNKHQINICCAVLALGLGVWLLGTNAIKTQAQAVTTPEIGKWYFLGGPTKLEPTNLALLAEDELNGDIGWTNTIISNGKPSDPTKPSVRDGSFDTSTGTWESAVVLGKDIKSQTDADHWTNLDDPTKEANVVVLKCESTPNSLSCTIPLQTKGIVKEIQTLRAWVSPQDPNRKYQNFHIIVNEGTKIFPQSDSYFSYHYVRKISDGATQVAPTALGANNPPDTQNTGASGALVANANPTCPKTPPKEGPSEGTDYQAQIAKAFEEELAKRGNLLEAAAGGYDESAEKLIVDEAMKFAPNSDGTTKFKYTSGGRGPSTFDCSGFVDYVLKKAKAQGANIDVGTDIFTRSYASVGKVIHKIDLSKFTLANGGARLRTKSDMPELSMLRPGDILFFGTSGACGEGKKQCPNLIGHMGIYLGDGKFIHSTTSDKDPNRDSQSGGNPTTEPPIGSHPQGSLYSSYNGVKIDSLYDSYFTPDFYIQTNRVTHMRASGYFGTYGQVEGLGTTAYPGGNSASISFNSCHGSSACNPAEDSGHGVYQNRGQGDALDITPRDRFARAAFNGTASVGGSGRNSYTVVTSSNGRVKAFYYHTINLKTGAVSAGEAVAKVGAGGIGHIHFELLVDGKSVNGNQALRSNPTAYQQSLWVNMQKVLGLK